MPQTILIAEDDRIIRDLVKQVLAAGGHRVIPAANPKEALEAVADHEGDIDLLLTDVMMPSMSGPDLAVEMRKLHPAIRVIYMSGVTNYDKVQRDIVASGTPFLKKPFSMEDLNAAVNRALAAPPTTGTPPPPPGA